MTEPLHVAFVWHMHQPYYRFGRTGPFEMPWARLHGLKDYLDMVETLGAFPELHQTFNLVPSLVEQLEAYAGGRFRDVYWDQTLKPASELSLADKIFLVDLMCERSDHPRARAHPRYLQLALKKEALLAQGLQACAQAFSEDDLRDLQIWFNLAWFDPRDMEAEPLADLLRRGRGFREEDKTVLAQVQADLLARTLPAYREAEARGQVELSTTPFFHPILPLLVNTDTARLSAADTVLPRARFAHPEDAAEQVRSAVANHERVFGSRPVGMWCAEQAVGEDVLPLLLDAGIQWTISDETVLRRSLAGAAAPDASRVYAQDICYAPYRLDREGRDLAIVFRDHTLSDLIGFTYKSWESADAAADLIRRLHELHQELGTQYGASKRETPLVTIALDGENAWEYYPRDGRDFLLRLYEGLSADPELRCVTVSEHLKSSPPSRSLGWLHTGSWIGGDLTTWIGTPAHDQAWALLHETRDLVAARRAASENPHEDPLEEAWHHVLVCEGSDWFWWFGEHHHTQLDAQWDLNFRRHLQEAYRLLGEPIPHELFVPLLSAVSTSEVDLPVSSISPALDGIIDPTSDEWANAGVLRPAGLSTMQRADERIASEIRFGWDADNLYLLLVPSSPRLLPGLELEIHFLGAETAAGSSQPELMLGLGLELETEPAHWDSRVPARVPAETGESELALLRAVLADHPVPETEPRVEVTCVQHPALAASFRSSWREVIEMALPLESLPLVSLDALRLRIGVGREGVVQELLPTRGSLPLGSLRT